MPVAALVLGALVATSTASAALAESPPRVLVRPEAPTTIVVPFPAGGGSGAIAESIGPAMAGVLGVRVAIDYRPGEDGQLGARTVAGAVADGRTLLLGSTSSLLAPALVGGGRIFDPVAEFEPVALVGTIPRIIAVHPTLPVQTMDDLVRLVRAGQQVRCGYSDAVGEFASAEFARLTGAALQCENYGGITPRMREDVASGRVNLTFENAFLPDIRRGALRPLAVTSSWRLPSLPDVPTASEAGVAGLEVTVWLALFVPPGTATSTVALLREAVLAALAQPAVRDALNERGYVLRTLSPLQTKAFLQADVERWRKAQVRGAKRSGGSRAHVASTRQRVQSGVAAGVRRPSSASRPTSAPV